MPPRSPALVTRLSDFETLLEVGIGRRHDVARELADRGADVRAIDIHPVDPPDGVRVRVADVHEVDRDDPDPFFQVEAVYSLNCPPELQRPVHDLARAVDARFLFTTLGFDEPDIPVEREQVDDEILYVADPGRRGSL